MADEIKYQSVTVEFPKTLYVLALWLDLGYRTPFFLQEVYEDLETLRKNADDSLSELKEKVENKEKVIDSHVLVAEINYVKKYPLNKKMWEGSEIAFDQINRNLHFIFATDKQDLYKIAITPVLNNTKAEKFMAVFAYPVSEEDNLETLMKSSDIFVSPEAKSAGIYKIAKTFDLELTTGKKITDKKEKTAG